MNIALVPAKKNSRRIPNKNMMDFFGKPLFMWSVEQALNSKLVDKVVISTDIKQIASCVDEVQVIERPDAICGDNTTQEEVIAHAIESLNLKDDDNIVLLQPTSPLRLYGDIDKCIRQKAFSAIAEDDLYLWVDDDYVGYPHTVNFEMEPRSKDDESFFRENGSIYVINVKQFKKSNSRYNDIVNFYTMQKWQQFEIDTPEDIPIVEYFMKTKILLDK